MTDRICLFCRDKPVASSRPDAKFCSDRCRKRWQRAQKAVTIPDRLPEPAEEPVTASRPAAALPAVYPGDKVDPPRPSGLHRHGDHDIRDTWARSQGSEFTEELPAFLRKKQP